MDIGEIHKGFSFPAFTTCNLYKSLTKKICKRSQVPGSTFRVRDKDKIEDLILAWGGRKTLRRENHELQAVIAYINTGVEFISQQWLSGSFCRCCRRWKPSLQERCMILPFLIHP